MCSVRETNNTELIRFEYEQNFTVLNLYKKNLKKLAKTSEMPEKIL